MRPLSRSMPQRLLLAVGAAFCTVPASAQEIVTFDDLPNPPPLYRNYTLAYANNDSSLLNGVLWDDRLVVMGDQFGTSSTQYARPHSGHYALVNDFGVDNIRLLTDKTLMGVWFGQNEYSNGRSGATSVTVNALSGTDLLASVSMNLTSTTLSYLDTGAFAGLSGITEYRIDRVGSENGGHWIADDFTFATAAASVPAPPGLAVALLGALPGLLHARRVRRHRACQRISGK